MPQCIANRTVCIVDSGATYRTNRTGRTENIATSHHQPHHPPALQPPPQRAATRPQAPATSRTPPATSTTPPATPSGHPSSHHPLATSQRQPPQQEADVGRWLEAGVALEAGEAGGWRQVAGAILAIHIPLNTAYVSVSTEPPDYNHVN